jgi:hypothetical protein
MTPMRRFTCLILISVFSLAFAGCQEDAKKKPDPSIDGITLADLMPTKREKKTASINLKIFTFHIPIANYPIVSQAFNILSKDQMRFSNYKSFHLNGFEAGLGTIELWKFAGDTLKRAGARRSKTSSLIIHDDMGSDFLTGQIFSQTVASYYALDSTDTETTLPPGFIGWIIKSRVLAERRGMAQLKIQGIFKRQQNNRFSQIPGFDNGQIVFKPSTIVAKINEGDFILLGPDPKTVRAYTVKDDFQDDPSKIERIALADLFFQTTADLIIPKTPDQEQDPKKPIKKTYRHAKNVQVIEVYLIACMGVEN